MICKYSGLKKIYYTNDHEWIDFNKRDAYIGVADFKLIGVGQILHIKLNTLSLDLSKGQPLGLVISRDYEIPFHMPVDGKLIDYNEYLLSNPALLCDKSLHNRWLVKIIPNKNTPDEDLIQGDRYFKQLNRSVS